MDRVTLEERVRDAEAGVVWARERTARQRALIQTLEQRGDDAATERQDLQALEAQEQADIVELERLTLELAAFDRRSGP